VRRPTRREQLGIGGLIAVVLAVGVLAASFGPHAGFLWHRVLPFERGPAGAVGLRYHVDEETFWLGLYGRAVACVESTDRRGCAYVVHVRRPGDVDLNSRFRRQEGWVAVKQPMLWLERLRRGRGSPNVQYVEVVAAVPLPAELAGMRLLTTETRDVVAFVGDPDPDGWHPARAAWKADTRTWRLARVDPAGLRGEDPNQPARRSFASRLDLYAAVAEYRVRQPAGIKIAGAASTDWGRKGHSITHLHDEAEGNDVVVVRPDATIGVSDVEVIPHEGERRLIYGLVSEGRLRDDLVGLLAVDDKGIARSVHVAWRLTPEGSLHPVPVQGLSCRLTEARAVPGGVCQTSYDNMVELRGAR
jgi:hypothetical protein